MTLTLNLPRMAGVAMMFSCLSFFNVCGTGTAASTAAPTTCQDPDPAPPSNVKALSDVQLRTIIENAKQTKKTIDLSGRDLRGKDLRGLDLSLAIITDANLQKARLNGAKLRGAVFKRSYLLDADFSGAQLGWAFFADAKLQRATFNGAHLHYTSFSHAVLDNAKFIGADAYGTIFDQAQLHCTDFTSAYMNGASLKGDVHHRTDLTNANLSFADLYDARLNFASLNATNLAGTKLAHAVLNDAIYDPRGAPPDGNVAGIKGIVTLQIPTEQQGGLVLLRKRMEDAGLRDEEREATYTIESSKTAELLGQPSTTEKRSAKFSPEGLFRVVAFDWTTSYGLHPGHALWLIFYLWAALIVVYGAVIVFAGSEPGGAGIYKVLPADRIEEPAAGKSADRKVVRVTQPLTGAGLLRAGVFGAYFSLLSAFNIGFESFDIGDWIRRLQPVEYMVQAVGWVRVVAGVQALLSLYLFAIWVLTFFGHPFQ